MVCPIYISYVFVHLLHPILQMRNSLPSLCNYLYLNWYLFTFSHTDAPDEPSRPEFSNRKPTSVNLTWNPPEFDGGAPIIGYNIEKRDTYHTKWVKDNITPVPETTYKVTTMTEGINYEFRVKAVNKVGPGKPSPVARSPVYPPDKPGMESVILWE